MMQFAVAPTGILLNNLDLQTTFLLVFKAFLVLSIVLYVLFSGLILRQIRLMSNTVQTPFTPTLWIFAIINFCLSLLVLITFLGL